MVSKEGFEKSGFRTTDVTTFQASFPFPTNASVGVESKARIKERLSPWPLTPLDVTQRTPRTPRTAFLSLNTYFDHRSRRTPTRRVAKMMKTQSSINASSMKKSIGRTKPSAAAAVAAANPNLGEMPPLHGACHRYGVSTTPSEAVLVMFHVKVLGADGSRWAEEAVPR